MVLTLFSIVYCTRVNYICKAYIFTYYIIKIIRASADNESSRKLREHDVRVVYQWTEWTHTSNV